jgi:hypothetical protein
MLLALYAYQQEVIKFNINEFPCPVFFSRKKATTNLIIRDV